MLSAAWAVPASFGRGLLPRSAIDQAVATGVVATVNYELTTATWAALEAAAALWPGRRPTPRATMIASGLTYAGGMLAARALEPYADSSLATATVHTSARRLAYTALAGGSITAAQTALHRVTGVRPGLDTTLLPTMAMGAGVATAALVTRGSRARRYGLVDPDRPAVRSGGAGTLAKAGVLGIGAAVGMSAIAVAEQAVAGLIEKALARVLGEDAGAAGGFLAHSATLAPIVVGSAVALRRVTAGIEKRDDIVEPAYQRPPTSVHVSAGPRSLVPFDSIGKEGRRFVLMALEAGDIEKVMGEPAVDPVRVVAGFDAAPTVEERAQLAVRELEAVGGFERGLICVAAPTGVGYCNYVVAEALEYLTRGDCAIVVPQYALVPSALALPETMAGVRLTRLVLEGIRRRVEAMPEADRPRVVLLGESLGANVALDVAAGPGTVVGPREFDHLGVSGGLYLGVPFRTELWKRWREYPDAIDPDHRLILVSQPDEADPPVPGVGRHLLVVHHDDPVNKFAYTMVVERPWWLGPPASRPPMVPRETRFRSITSFVLAVVDLKNGMQSRPGTFVRRGHDYRIDARLGLQVAYGLLATPEQVERIEAALRSRESAWAARRLVSRKYDEARRAIAAAFEQWGGQALDIDVADLDPTAAEIKVPLASRLGSSAPGA